MNDHNQRLYQEGQARFKRLMRLREKGMTLEEIADIEGCSKQRVDQIFQRYGAKAQACQTA